MSHFSALVITPNKPTESELKDILQPWHQYECTGINDQYVIDVDVTDEVEGLWNELKEAVKFPDGKIVGSFDSRFYTKIGTYKKWDGTFEKEFELPEGCELVTVPRSQICESEGKTKQQFAEDYGSWEFKNGRFYKYTNPNAKWDWWMIGGRYSGKFAPEYDPETDPNHKETCWLCSGTGIRRDHVVNGKCNGCNGTGIAIKWPTEWKNTPGNQIRVDQIPWNAMRSSKVANALAYYDKIYEAVKGLPIPEIKWKEMCEQMGIQQARAAYAEIPFVAALRKAQIYDVDEAVEILKKDRSVIAQEAAQTPITCWAFVKDGQWCEQGEMGWFATSKNNKDKDDWTKELNGMIESLPSDHWITCVDCHI